MFRSAAGTKKATRTINELGTRQDGSGQAGTSALIARGAVERGSHCSQAQARSLPLASRSFWACLDSVLSRLGLRVDGGGWVDLGLKSIVDSMK